MARVIYLIPALKSNDWLVSAIKSIDKDGYKDKEILVVDNGSQSIDEIQLATLSHVNTRIKVIHERSPGVAEALNAGIDSCDCEFIARLDSDDLVLPGRTQRQVDALSGKSDLAGVGGNAALINEHGNRIGRLVVPALRSIEEMQCTLRFENPYIHPAMMLRASVLRSFRYDTDMVKCQDWDLWMRMAKARQLIMNLDDDLISYRRHPNQESVIKSQQADIKALRNALLRLDGALEFPYMFQRTYLEQARLTIYQAMRIMVRESVNIKNVYSLKKLASHLYRARLK